MNIEKLQLKGMLAETNKKFRALDTEASGLIILIRTLLNPYEDVLEIDVEKASASILRLNKITTEMRALREKKKKLESEFEL